jgi:hypothetical protein
MSRIARDLNESMDTTERVQDAQQVRCELSSTKRMGLFAFGRRKCMDEQILLVRHALLPEAYKSVAQPPRSPQTQLNRGLVDPS